MERLIATINDVIDDPDVQNGYPDKNPNTPDDDNTWCNRGALRIAEIMGYDTSPLLDKEEGTPYEDWTTANDVYANAVKAADDKIIEELTPQKAQEAANNGEVVIAVQESKNAPDGHGHVGVVAPGGDPNNPNIAQTGGIIGTKSASQSFKNNGKPIRYFALKKKE